MEELTKNNRFYFLFILLFLTVLFSEAQSSDCNYLKGLENTQKKEFKKGDTVKISFKNTGRIKIRYRLEVLMLINKDWVYSDFYTRYFNKKLSYKKLITILDSKLPYVPPRNYAIPSFNLNSNQIKRFYFVIDKKEVFKELIFFRVYNIYGKEGCNSILFNPFYFEKIK